MIKQPGYLNGPYDPPPGLGTPGMSLAQAEQNYDPKLAAEQKAAAYRSIRLQELTEMARNLEYMRQRLLEFDFQNESKALNQVIISLINHWNDERVHL